MPTPVAANQIVDGLLRLGLRGARVIVHASLSSFGRVDGGAPAVADALARVCRTVLLPAFTFAPAAAAPPDDRPQRNGADYAADLCGSDRPTPFTRELPVARPIGAVAEALRRRPDAVRSDHPLSSFAAIGPDAERYVDPHDWNEPLQPLERLGADAGQVLMLGTDLTSCTAIHLAEKRVGRRPFIRWARLADGRTVRVRVAGCSAGFEKLALVGPVSNRSFPRVGEVPNPAKDDRLETGPTSCENGASDRSLPTWNVREGQIGQARVRIFSLADVVSAAEDRLRQDPLALACEPPCRRCLDAAAGGPQ